MMERKKATCVACGAPCYPSTVGKEPRCQACRYQVDRLSTVAFDHCREVQTFNQQISPVDWRDSGEIKLPGDRPQILAFSGCWHIGGMHVDYDALERHIELIESTPDLHLFLMGDLGDFTIGPVGNNVHPVFEQAISPHAQLAVLDDVIDRVISKTKAACYGNHDWGRFEKAIGFSPVADMLSSRVQCFRGIARLSVELGGVDYSLLITHHAAQSKANPLLDVNNKTRDYGPRDLFVAAHTHNNAGAWCRKGDNYLVHYLRCGTFNVSDLFTARFFKPGTVEQPAAVIYPGEKRVVPFRCLEDAAVYMRGV